MEETYGLGGPVAGAIPTSGQTPWQPQHVGLPTKNPEAAPVVVDFLKKAVNFWLKMPH